MNYDRQYFFPSFELSSGCWDAFDPCVCCLVPLSALLGDFDPAEQDFAADLVYDLKQVGSLAPKTVNRLAKPGIMFDELRALVQEIAETYGENFFREKKTKQRQLEVIATVQRV